MKTANEILQLSTKQFTQTLKYNVQRRCPGTYTLPYFDPETLRSSTTCHDL